MCARVPVGVVCVRVCARACVCERASLCRVRAGSVDPRETAALGHTRCRLRSQLLCLVTHARSSVRPLLLRVIQKLVWSRNPVVAAVTWEPPSLPTAVR